MNTSLYLQHYGVKGMKWGVRKNRAKNLDYSDQQRKRDKQTYGSRGVKRINKAMNKGDRISVARGSEKTRRDKVMGRNKYVRQGGKLAGGAAGAVIGGVVYSKTNKALNNPKVINFMNNSLGTVNTAVLRMLVENPIARGAVMAGGAKVGYMMTGDAAVSANMRLYGYDPNRK